MMAEVSAAKKNREMFAIKKSYSIEVSYTNIQGMTNNSFLLF